MRLIDAEQAEKILSGFDWQDGYLPSHFQEMVLDECRTVFDIPCSVGDIVFADLHEKGEDGLEACVVESIRLELGVDEPMFIVSRQDENWAFKRFWASDFGKTIFTNDDYFQKFV